nr:sulfotransferase [Mycobacterium sp. 1165196.3]
MTTKSVGGAANSAEFVKTDSWSVGRGRAVVLFVLGTPRSGTSALTRVLNLCGGTLPAGMCGADAGNPRGYWEPREAIVLNETILRRHGSHWCDPTLRLQEEDAVNGKDKAAHIAKIVAYLTSLPAAPLVLIKEPRITLLSDLWFEAARLAAFDVAAVIAVRHPQEVISSMATWRVSPTLGSALWLKNNLLAERHTRGMRRVFIDYANLVDDWQREMRRISAALAIELNTANDDEIEGFLSPNLRRQRYCGPVTDLFGTDWVSVAYKALCAAASDEPVDGCALDRVFEQYRAGERDFRQAFDDSRDVSESMLSRFLRPSIAKPMMELAAIAHRRKGTWA